MRKSWINLFILIVLGLLFIHCQKKDKEQILALVAMSKGEPFITLEYFNQEFAKFEPKSRNLPADSILKLKKTLLDQLVEEKLILQKAEELGIKISDQELNEAISKIKEDYPEDSFNDMLETESFDLDAWKEGLRKRLIVNKTLNRVVYKGIMVSEGQLRAYYENHRELFYQQEQVRARQIVISTNEQAHRILKELRKKKDFAKLAMRYSSSPDAKKGGDLGYFHPGQMPKKFDEVVFSLPVGQISDVVQSPYGFHLFLVEERKEAYRQPLSEVRSQIAQKIIKEFEEKAYRDWIRSLKEKAKLTFHLDQLEVKPAEQSG